VGTDVYPLTQQVGKHLPACRGAVRREYSEGRWLCDLCDESFAPGRKQNRFRCIKGCNFDVCETCLASLPKNLHLTSGNSEVGLFKPSGDFNDKPTYKDVDSSAEVFWSEGWKVSMTGNKEIAEFSCSPLIEDPSTGGWVNISEPDEDVQMFHNIFKDAEGAPIWLNLQIPSDVPCMAECMMERVENGLLAKQCANRSEYLAGVLGDGDGVSEDDLARLLVICKQLASDKPSPHDKAFKRILGTLLYVFSAMMIAQWKGNSKYMRWHWGTPQVSL